ncbi:hypothetical protein HYC85_007373 [Camellia sinensis]|uniref:Alcohol dehydrogenase-like N-terminal domain-containing protein n=1 Tax=Camellia sinensis TaxID=4442 RepID=A0A7J7HQ02_CAMSI|nr:hypothetical protein HYC85_007373 [Camellia sinensis]
MSSERVMEEEGEGECHGWAARDASGFLSPYNFARRHEIVGIVKEVGSNVHRFKVGDRVGVGTYVNSCRDCEYCGMNMDVYCSKGAVRTFNSVDVDGTITKGGYSSYIVVHQRYCFKIPNDYPLALAAPLLCAGITVYSPMMRYKMNQPVFSTSISKKDEALKKLGADKFVISSDEEQMKAMVNSLNFIIDTASGDHPFDPYMSLLEDRWHPCPGMKSISGSVTGGIKESQEMLDFCAAQKIYPEIEIIPIKYINEALERLIKRDVKYRFVIDSRELF